MSGDPTQDDAFASLFRPEPPAAPEPPANDAVEATDDAPVDPERDEPTPRPATSTGRLFRSSTASEETGAIPALRSDQARGLRTVGAAATMSAPAPAVVISTGSVNAAVITPEPTPSANAKQKRRDAKEPRMAAPSGPGLAPAAVVLLVVVVTVVAGFIDVLIGAGLGWIWGVGMLLSSAYGAFAARRGDGTYAVSAPAIAALVSVLTVAQLNLGASGGSLFDRAVVAFFALGDHWTWIIGSTVVALVVVVVRARTRRA